MIDDYRGRAEVRRVLKINDRIRSELREATDNWPMLHKGILPALNRPLLLILILVSNLQLSTARISHHADALGSSANQTNAYKTGERLIYNISFAHIPVAAHAELEVVGRKDFNGRDGIELRAHLETVDIVNAALLALDDDFISRIDPVSGLPFYFAQIKRPPMNDPSAELTSSPSAPLTRVLNVASGAFDPLSAIYYLRALPLAIGARQRFRILYGSEIVEAEAQVRGAERINTNIGVFNALVVQIRVRNDQRLNDYRPQIYFSDDANHLPLLITIQHPAGEIRAEIASFEEMGSPTPNPETKRASPPVATRSVERLVPRGDLPFSPNEQLNFRLILGPTEAPIGRITLQARPRARYFDRDALLLTLTAQTSSESARLFSLNDRINSYVDPLTLLPFRIELQMREGSWSLTRTITVDQDRGLALQDDGKRIEIPVGTHDLLSVVYALRSFDLTPPKRNAVAILAISRPRTLYVTALQRTTIELSGQRIRAIELALTTDDAEGDKHQLRLWVSDDRRHLPLRLSAMTPFGPLRADLEIIPLIEQ